MSSVAKTVSAGMTALLVLSCGAAYAGDNAGHALAEKFAGSSKSSSSKPPPSKTTATIKTTASKTPKSDLKAEEAEMLARARQEAEERRAAAEKALAEAEAEDKRLAEEKREAEEKRLAEEAAKKAEAERQARIAEEARRAEEKRLAEEAAKKAEGERQARIAEEARRAEEARIAEEQRKAEIERASLEAEREKRAREIEDKLRAIETARTEKANRQEAEQQKQVAVPDEGDGEAAALPPSPPMGLGGEPKAAATSTAATRKERSGRVAILLVMDPGTNGIRRFGQKTADPVICSGSKCWISSGTEKPAHAVARGAALGPGNTLGRRADACNKSLGCIFREVDLGADEALLQPIDLRIMRHDRRQPLAVAADGTCRTAAGQLSCGTLYSTKTWRAWIVPEEIAEKAGVAALEAALRARLNPSREAALRQ